MIEQQARVVAVAPGLAWVRANRQSACRACSAAQDCGTAALSRSMSAAHDRVQVSDPIGVKVGDAVVVGIAEGALIRASLLAYLLPLLFLIVAAYGVRTAGGAEGVSALVGILALCFGIWMAPGLAHRLSGQDEYRPRLLERSHPLTAAVSLPAPGLPGGDSTY